MIVGERPWAKNLPRNIGEWHTSWQKSLVDQKYRHIENDREAESRITRQQKLLAAAAASATELAKEMRRGLNIPDAALNGIPALRRGVTDDEMRHPHIVWETELYETVSKANISRADTATPLFWTLCHIRWLEANVFPDPPARVFGAAVAGELLEADPLTLTQQQRCQLDGAGPGHRRNASIRNFLRNTGGIPHVRTRTGDNLRDCPATAAWWRCELARSAAQHADTGLDAASAHAVLASSGVWRAIVGLTTSRNVLLAPRALAGIITHLQELQTAGQRPTEKTAKAAFNRLGPRTINLSLSHMHTRQIAQICNEA